MKIFRKFSEKIMTRFGKITLRITSAIAVLLTVAILVSGFDFGSLQLTFYNLRSYRVNGHVRIVLLTDLHLREFGKGNEKLLAQVENLEPDIITVAGDLTVKGKENYDVALSLLDNLSEIAPTYFSYGNHEFSDILFKEGCTLQEDLNGTKATVLNKRYEKIEVNGTEIVIGGLCVSPEVFPDSCKDFMRELSNREEFRIVLCHHPECYLDSMADFPVDLALTGHAHGGQIRLPIIGGLYSPDQGFLPDLTEGLNELCGSNVVVSRGLGNSTPIPRYNNDPEIVVIDIDKY